MQDEFYNKVAKALAAERLDAYGKQDSADQCTVLARYLWNMALGEALYSPLQLCEVVLRNNMHARLSCLYGECWFESPTKPFALTKWGGEKVDDALAELKRQRKPATPGQVVAELNFGFWTHLLEDHYERGTSFMPKNIKYVFPYLPKSEHKRKDIKRRLDKIRALRNRVFHHERVCHWVDLTSQHGEILDVIRWCSHEIHELATKLDRFTSIYSEGIEPWKEKIRSHWPKESTGQNENDSETKVQHG
jgi:hypothetical protein